MSETQRKPANTSTDLMNQQGAPDIVEHGADGQTLDARLFMQLLAFTGCRDTDALIEAVRTLDVPAVLYANVHDPFGVALLTMSRDPGFFTGDLRQLMHDEPFNKLTLKHDYTMFGRTYALGYEKDLNEVLFNRPRNTALNGDWPWVVWYPLRRSGAFEQLEQSEQRDILMQHARIGMSFGKADYAHDIRLACHGLDPHDNDFVLGLTGKELHPLSALVQTMRKTTQTSQYIERLGPFFVGRAVHQHNPNRE